MRTTKHRGVDDAKDAKDAETKLTQRLNVRVTPSAYRRAFQEAGQLGRR